MKYVGAVAFSIQHGSALIRVNRPVPARGGCTGAVPILPVAVDLSGWLNVWGHDHFVTIVSIRTASTCIVADNIQT